MQTTVPNLIEIHSVVTDMKHSETGSNDLPIMRSFYALYTKKHSNMKRSKCRYFSKQCKQCKWLSSGLWQPVVMW